MRISLSDNRWRAALAVFTLFFCIAVSFAAANQPVYDYRPGDDAATAGPARAVGSLAPDMALPTLHSYLPGAKNVELKRLSDYRGKRPVVLLLTGYT